MSKTIKKKLRSVPVKRSVPPAPQTPAPDCGSPARPIPDASSSVAIAALENALAAVRELSAQRLAAHLSVSRLTGVARELKDLLKVMSVYGV